jgi:hypothetical protein
MIRLTLWSGFIMLVATMFLGLMAPEKAEANLLCGPSGAMDLNFGTATTTAGMAAWNSAAKPTIQLYDEAQLKSGLYVGWIHLPFLYHERAA